MLSRSILETLIVLLGHSACFESVVAAAATKLLHPKAASCYPLWLLD
jgi:hypothetical protein